MTCQQCNGRGWIDSDGFSREDCPTCDAAWRAAESDQGGEKATSDPYPVRLLNEYHGLDTAERVCFYEQDFYVLSNFSAFSLMWREERFDTSEAAYHWEKFPGHAGVRYAIFTAPSAHEAFKVAERNKDLRRVDWDEVKVDIMRDILRAKVTQHEYVRRKLLATGERELVENSWRDDYWGWGPNRDGQNMLGKLWMEVRTEFREEAFRSDTAAALPAAQWGSVPQDGGDERVLDSVQPLVDAWIRSRGTSMDGASYVAALQLAAYVASRAAPIAAVTEPNALPQTVLDVLRFYAHGHHYNIDAGHQQFDTVSSEPQNWLMSEQDDDCTMIEDGSIAKALLLGRLNGFEEPPEPLEGEVFAAAAARTGVD